jgi:ATP-dependent Clp protease adaptor protein ClpS
MDNSIDHAVHRKRKQKLKEPEDYKVILLNDDFTPMDFVVEILMDIFHRNAEDAERIMMQVHQHGQGVAGVYTYDIAETKVRDVTSSASAHEFPLACIMEKA